MKTRIIKTKFWGDDKVFKLSKDAKLLFIYLLTCQEIGLTGAFELQDELICTYTGLADGELKKAKAELARAKRAYFKKSWVVIIRAGRHNKYRASGKTLIAYKRELDELPGEIRRIIDTTINSSGDSNHKTETINHKTENRKQKTERKKMLKKLKEVKKQWKQK